MIFIDYVCLCGKSFNSANALNGHKAGCLVYLSTKIVDAERILTDRYNRSIKSFMRNTNKRAEDLKLLKKQKFDKWLSEQHKCENCGKVMTEYYGSGRFCSSFCARSASNSKSKTTKILVTDFKCDLCNKYFKSQYSLNVHIGLKHHVNLSEQFVKIKNGDRLDITYGELDKYRQDHKSCEICGRQLDISDNNTDLSVNVLCIDHIHSNLKFRGLLCLSCNRSLGWFENNKESILKYLELKEHEGS